jgi:hypothetical protein
LLVEGARQMADYATSKPRCTLKRHTFARPLSPHCLLSQLRRDSRGSGRHL